jgi:putative transcriptional regulator
MTDMTHPKTSPRQITHHLDEATLLAYAAGSLPEAFNLIVATHLSMCDTCRADALAYDAVGGALMDDEAASMTGDALEKALAALDGSAALQPAAASGKLQSAAALGKPCNTLPAPLQNYVGGDLDSVRWRPVGMGVRQAVLRTSKGATARLLCIPAGAAMPDHGHHGRELTLVIKGAFRDADDYFSRGDIEFADSDVQHIPIADIHEDCICLAITDAPLRFAGFLPRILQRFAGI